MQSLESDEDSKMTTLTDAQIAARVAEIMGLPNEHNWLKYGYPDIHWYCSRCGTTAEYVKGSSPPKGDACPDLPFEPANDWRDFGRAIEYVRGLPHKTAVATLTSMLTALLRAAQDVESMLKAGCLALIQARDAR